MFIRSKSNNMGMNANGSAIVLDASDSHGPTLGPWISPTLLLKSQAIQDRLRSFQKAVRI